MHWLISISPTLTPPTLLSTCPTKAPPLEAADRGDPSKEGASGQTARWEGGRKLSYESMKALDPERKAQRGVLETALCCVVDNASTKACLCNIHTVERRHVRRLQQALWIPAQQPAASLACLPRPSLMRGTTLNTTHHHPIRTGLSRLTLYMVLASVAGVAVVGVLMCLPCVHHHQASLFLSPLPLLVMPFGKRGAPAPPPTCGLACEEIGVTLTA
jgi:hypothetical protein